MKFKSLFLAAFVVLLGASATFSSQNSWQWEGIDLFSINGGLIKPSYELDDNPRLADLFSEFYFQVPVFLKEDNPNYWGVGFTGNLCSFTDTLLSDLSGSAGALSLVVGYNRQIRSDLHIYAEYNGGISGWWKDIQTDNVSHLLLGYLGYTRESSKQLYFRAGLALRYSFGKFAIPLPIVGISAALNDRYALELLAPVHALVRMRINEKIETGLKGAIAIEDICIHDSTDDLHYNIWRLVPSLYIDLKITNNLISRIETGSSYVIKYEVKTRSGEILVSQPPSPTNPFVNVSLRWAL